MQWEHLLCASQHRHSRHSLWDSQQAKWSQWGAVNRSEQLTICSAHSLVA